MEDIPHPADTVWRERPGILTPGAHPGPGPGHVVTAERGVATVVRGAELGGTAGVALVPAALTTLLRILLRLTLILWRLWTGTEMAASIMVRMVTCSKYQSDIVVTHLR